MLEKQINNMRGEEKSLLNLLFSFVRNKRTKGIPHNDMPSPSVIGISVRDDTRKDYPTLWMIQPVA